MRMGGSMTTELSRERIIEQLREQGLRITSQRKVILDVILKNNCSCCKEIFYEATKIDPAIGRATVYRMMNTLEELGVIDRGKQYEICYEGLFGTEKDQTSLLTKEEMKELPKDIWYSALKKMLRALGEIKDEDISVVVKVSRKSS